METSIELWEVGKVIDEIDRINLNPTWQRGKVWPEPKKVLLIDSLFRGYDLPKLYFRKLDNNALHDYEVGDGQQRIRAIIDYVNGDFSLPAHPQLIVNNHNIAGLRYSELPVAVQRQLRKGTLTISVITNASGDEIRALFARLQMGVTLVPAEKRNAVASVIGTEIDTFVKNHSFFEDSKIADKRFKRHDYLAHGIGLMYYNNTKDLKANLLMQLYEDLQTAIPTGYRKKVQLVLEDMRRVNEHAKGCLRNKWTFVDIFNFFHSCREQNVTAFDYKGIANALVRFDRKRKDNLKEPQKLVEGKTPSVGNKNLYSYLQAFRVGGGNKGNITIRADVFKWLFEKYV